MTLMPENCLQQRNNFPSDFRYMNVMDLNCSHNHKTANYGLMRKKEKRKRSYSNPNYNKGVQCTYNFCYNRRFVILLRL